MKTVGLITSLPLQIELAWRAYVLGLLHWSKLLSFHPQQVMSTTWLTVYIQSGFTNTILRMIIIHLWLSYNVLTSSSDIWLFARKEQGSLPRSKQLICPHNSPGQAWLNINDTPAAILFIAICFTNFKTLSWLPGYDGPLLHWVKSSVVKMPYSQSCQQASDLQIDYPIRCKKTTMRIVPTII